ncbi:MAG: ComF family protein [Candidatus Promineifilaceae bacterium]|nr:ComF family protein [Candidatus Promineifilaceae bacterium]
MPHQPAVPWRQQLRHVVASALNFVFPPVCVSCREIGAVLCASCQEAVIPIEPPLCARCGQPLLAPAVTCAGCQSRAQPLRQIRAAAYFSGVLADALHEFKYEGSFALAEPFAAFMMARWPAWPAPPDVLVPVPLHAARKRERGYNQSELLAHHLSRQLGLPCTPQLIRRVRFTRPQVGLTRSERVENVRDAFRADRRGVRNSVVLLVDDVYTTGATLGAAAEALLGAGATSVLGYCLARPAATEETM